VTVRVLGDADLPGEARPVVEQSVDRRVHGVDLSAQSEQIEFRRGGLSGGRADRSRFTTPAISLALVRHR
jgi:hypothetical protein